MRLRLRQPIRAYALAIVDGAELEAAAERHLRAYCALAAEQAPRLFGPGEQAALDRLEADHDNLRAALSLLIEHRRVDETLRLIGSLWWLWFSRGHFEEGCRWVAEALALDDRPSRERVRALRAASHLTWWRGDYAQTDVYNAQLQACAEAIGDAWGVAWALMGFGAVKLVTDPAAALPLLEGSRRRFTALGRDWEAGYALQMVGATSWFVGNERAAVPAYEEAVTIFERLGHGSVLASVRRGAGLMAARSGQARRGKVLCEEALRFTDSIGDRVGSAQAHNFLGSICREQGELGEAVEHFVAALALAREIGDLWGTCSALDGIANAACRHGEHELAARLLGCSGVLARRSGYRPTVHEAVIRAADVEALRGRLSASAFEQAQAEGELLAVADAVTASQAFAARHG
jgi:non-specific serine/threonine protein kinase